MIFALGACTCEEPVLSELKEQKHFYIDLILFYFRVVHSIGVEAALNTADLLEDLVALAVSANVTATIKMKRSHV